MNSIPAIDVLIFGQSAYLVWCTTPVDERFTATRHFAVDAGALDAILRKQKPELALIECRTIADTRATIAQCKKSNPLMQIVVLYNGATGSCQFAEDEVFATVRSDSDAIEIIAILNNAVAVVKQLRASQLSAERRRQSRQAPAQWLLLEQSAETDRKLEYAASLIRNILHTASQGLGVGAVLTYVDLLQMSKDSNTTPDQAVLSALVQNAEAARHWLAAFENILHGLGKKYPQVSIAQIQLQSVMDSAVVATEAFRRIKNQIIDARPVVMIGAAMASSEALAEILTELLLNAYKFSPERSRVSVLSHDTREYLSVKVVNEIQQLKGGISGIPVEYEERIFEPFFRLNNTWDDRFHEERYGLGCGLTLAEHAAQQCGGRLYLYEVGKPQPDDGERRIVAELMLPKME